MAREKPFYSKAHWRNYFDEQGKGETNDAVERMEGHPEIGLTRNSNDGRNSNDNNSQGVGAYGCADSDAFEGRSSLENWLLKEHRHEQFWRLGGKD